ncbi:GAF domain-containing protein [Myroides odoratimimus]|uniref:GAF domain-containing protein n=1 Tax=Myroides odoratimimus TaxID=76832 RepID=UPI002DB8B063|nr:GAF domain-containing protein [Myroides odoratimimus]MEC4051372.1 GAF domain-containing protein [Myroides odoratimimus]
MNNLYQELLVATKAILESNVLDRTEKLKQVCVLLNEKISYYDWVGFYFAVPEERVLHLGPYSGPETDHTVIPFGKGICGQVAVSNETFLVEDVTAQDNYIACSITVKSEIVVPLFVDGVNIGQIDIDSNTINAFTAEDQSFLELLNVEIAKLFI